MKPTPAKCRRRPFSVVEKLQMQMCLMDYFKRLGTIPKMKTERFTAVKRSVLYEYHRICVRRSFMLYLLGNPDEAVPRQPEIIRTAGTSR